MDLIKLIITTFPLLVDTNHHKLKILHWLTCSSKFKTYMMFIRTQFCHLIARLNQDLIKQPEKYCTCNKPIIHASIKYFWVNIFNSALAEPAHNIHDGIIQLNNKQTKQINNRSWFTEAHLDARKMFDDEWMLTISLPMSNWVERFTWDWSECCVPASWSALWAATPRWMLAWLCCKKLCFQYSRY